MNKVPGIVKLIGVLVLVVALGVAIGWLSSSSRRAEQPAPELPPLAMQDDPVVTTPEPPPVRAVEPNPQNVAAPVVKPQEVPAAGNIITNWEDRLEEILGGEEDEPEKARRMAAILPRLPEEGQVEVAQHLSNLVADEDYGMLAPFLTDATLPEDVLDVLIADSLNRPNAVKLPLLLDVAREPKNPKAEEAREILELFLEVDYEDYGQDWAKWQAKLQEWLKANPD